ncbi:ThuA domain-containing protein [Reichenbachiella sp. MALMAid0571]|uniref:ThuA domain-containing protein n=1 Tax=Reichenbachiella sp. MALMAid0571 TaxID=3143939 RepID=UPI0032DF3242
MRKLFQPLFTICMLVLMMSGNTVIAQKYEALIITGQNNHYWQGSSVVIEGILNNSGMFNATTVTTPAKGEDMSGFRPDFSKYDLICLDYNGDSWPEETKLNFVDFVKKGGGLVVFHASDNSFSDWEEYNQMIGVGGWGGRTEKDGPILYWEDGKIKKDTSEGRGGSHGQQDQYVVHTRMPDHPIMKGLPESWLHTPDELYHSLRGPAKNMQVLATSSQPKDRGGSGRQEPVLMTVKYGKGRVFHSVMGHTGKNHNNTTLDAGFMTTYLRGAEWVVTGNVTQKVSSQFPDAENVVIWEDMKVPE